MKDRNWTVVGMVWIVASPLIYVLSSGPALLLNRTPAWPVLKVIYWPLKKAVPTTPGYKILLPYWDLWHDREMNPLIPG